MWTLRAWIFRCLVLAASGVFLYAWFLPLWGLDVAVLRPDAVLVRSWGEELFLGELATMVSLPTLPAILKPLLWAYLVVCLVVLVSSTFWKNKSFRLGRFHLSLQPVMIGGVGLAHLIFAIVAALMIRMNLGQFEVKGVTVPLQGTVVLDFGMPYTGPVTASLRSGYWVAWGVGILLIALALFRNSIMGSESDRRPFRV